jgi:NAD-dependent dihydropyrimidine dehydrogenase PreA subunit
MNRIEIDRDACTACGTCYDACFVDVYRWDEESDQPLVAYPEDCVGCNKCELECPEECIKVVVDFPGIYWPEVV